MSTRIPLPGVAGEDFLKGLDSGSNMFARMMAPQIEREKQKQQQAQFEQELALRKAAAARAAQAADMGYQFQQFNKLAQMFGGGQPQDQTGAGGQNIPPQQPIAPPQQEMGEGMGMFSPEGMQEAQQQPQQPQQPMASPQMGGQPPMPSSGNPMMDKLKQNPMLRAFFKHKFGFDPLATDKSLAYHGSASEGYDLSRLKKEFGENSEEYQTAKEEHQSKIDARKDLRDLRGRTKSGLKTGEKEFFDETSGEPLGKEIPLTEKERASEEGNILFNELYPIAYKGGSPFSGEGSIRRLQKAFENYKTDPRAAKLVDDLLLSDKVMAATTVNEASTLKSGHTNQTYTRLKDSLETQDIPKLIKKFAKEYGLPASASLKASMRYQEALSNARKKARKSTPATQRLYYNPEMQAQNEAEKELGVIKKRLKYNPETGVLE